MPILKKDIVLELSRDYSISAAAIGQIIEFLMYRKYDPKENSKKEPFVTSEFLELNDMALLKDLIIDYIKKIQTPQQWFSICLNLTKIDSKSQIMDELKSNAKKSDSEAILDPGIPSLAYFKVIGPNKITLQPIILMIDRYAAESVLIGANLYIPGFFRSQYHFDKGQKVSMVTMNNYHVGNGITQVSGKDLLTIKKGIGIETTEPLYRNPNYRDTELWNQGSITDHTFSPHVACWALMSQFEEGMQIMDACSAPGHKTCAFSMIGNYMLHNVAFPKVISVDRSANRLSTLTEDIKRLKLENIRIVTSKIEDLKEKNPELVDANDLVLMDPPCSALGTRPKLMIDDDWEFYRSCFLAQRNILKEIGQFIKKDGYLLYNTCTMTLLENEGILSYAISRLGYKPISIWNSFQKVLPNRFIEPGETAGKQHKILEERKNESLQKPFGNELHYGICLNDKLTEELWSSNQAETDKSRYVLQNLPDIRKYITIKPEDAKKVVRTYPDLPNTTGYFMALLQKQ
jgi:16S rRNA C967 or C1407 C5-methylase (RsmB/RsmF family)